MEKAHYMLQFKRDWADEFDAQEFVTFRSNLTVEEMVESIAKRLEEDPSEEFYFGTNEFFLADEIYPSDINIVPLTQSQYETISEIFTGFHDREVQFGTGIANTIKYMIEE